MYSRTFESPQLPNNYRGTLYREAPKEETVKNDEPEENTAPVFKESEKSTEKPDSLLSKGFSIRLDTEDLLLLGLVFLLMANGEESDMMLILSLLFATGIFF